MDLITNEITMAENEELTKAVINAEIKNMVFNIGKGKSPGPDGFPDGFFQHHWDIVDPFVT